MELTERTALLVIDMQNDSLPGGFYPVDGMQGLVENVRRVIEACRRRHLPVLYTQHTHRPDGIGASLGEPLNAQGRPEAYVKGTRGWNVADGLAPQPSEFIIEKSRWSGFYATDLELILRSLGVQSVIITGVVTDGCVQTTVYDAFFRDYPVVLVKDGCGAYNQGCHEAAVLNMVNWVYGLTVMTTEDLVAALEGKPHRAWHYRTPNSKPFTAETMHSLYEEV